MFSPLSCGLHEHRAPVRANFAIEVHMLKCCRALQWMHESKHESIGLCRMIRKPGQHPPMARQMFKSEIRRFTMRIVTMDIVYMPKRQHTRTLLETALSINKTLSSRPK